MNLRDLPHPDVEGPPAVTPTADLQGAPNEGLRCPRSRKAIDWENVERHYRAGLVSVREIGKQCGVSHVAIQKRAKADGWTRDLSGRIRAKARAELVTTQPVTAAVTAETRRTEREVVEQAAATIVQIVREHRRDIAKARAAIERMLVQLERDTELRLPAQAGTLRDLTMALKTLVALEREAFSVDEKEPDVKAPTGETPLEVFEARIAKLTGVVADATDD